MDGESVIVMTTFAKNKHRTNESSFPFSFKMDILHRGLAFESKVIAVGIMGDTDRQTQQMQLVASLSYDKSIHYICGDDAFTKKVSQAKNGDESVLELFKKEVTFYISKRKGSKNGLLDGSCVYAKNMNCKVVFLPDQQLNLSGTRIREKSTTRNLNANDYPNKYVESFFKKTILQSNS